MPNIYNRITKKYLFGKNKKKKGRKKMEKLGNRRNKKIGKEQVKTLFIEIIARLIYYIITTIIGISAILLVLGTIGAIVNLCTINKIYCICLLVVCGYIITRWIIEETR